MQLRCAGCAGCCVDWRPIAPAVVGAGDAGDADDASNATIRWPALDDTDSFVQLTRDEVVRLLKAGYGDVLMPRLFAAAEIDNEETVDSEFTDRKSTGYESKDSEIDDSVTANSVSVDDIDLAAIDGRPVFVIGLRKPPKPVAPIGTDSRHWLHTCTFLDPTTLQCRIHETDLYPDRCAIYPAHNLELDVETECDRVETAGGGIRLLERSIPANTPAPPLGPHALGSSIFAYPRVTELSGVVDRLVAGTATADDRARFAGAAVGSRPGSLAVDDDRMADGREQARSAESWAGVAIDTWQALAGDDGDVVDFDDRAWKRTVRRVEDDAGAPETPGWDDVDNDGRVD